MEKRSKNKEYLAGGKKKDLHKKEGKEGRGHKKEGKEGEGFVSLQLRDTRNRGLFRNPKLAHPIVRPAPDVPRTGNLAVGALASCWGEEKSECSKGAAKASCGETVVQKGVLESPFLLCPPKVCS